jgi:AcrR family transcriptional regulator
MLSLDNMPKDTQREKSEVRRLQIIAATLELLSNGSIEQVSTRQIAAALGLSQPALFRHFASKEALLVAVVEHSRDELGALGQNVLRDSEDADARLQGLAHALFSHVDRHPGLPRLLFAQAAIGSGPLFEALRDLYAMQTSLVTELVRQGQREGVLRADVAAKDAATAFIGLLQGATLSRRLAPARNGSLSAEGARLFGIWFRGMHVATRVAPLSFTADASAPLLDVVGCTPALRALDVRPSIASGVDPLEAILAALVGVGPNGVLVVTAPFRPAPLVSLLESRGHRVCVEAQGKRQFRVEIVNGGGPPPEDLRDLEAPEPLERCLLAASRLTPGGAYLARLPRFPRLLVPHLEERGIAFQILEEADESALLRLSRGT